jgi:hypothetical protein
MEEPITDAQIKEVIDCEGWPGYIRAMARELAEFREETRLPTPSEQARLDRFVEPLRAKREAP